MSDTRLTLAAIAAALLLFPLTLEKPGRPVGLDAVEPTVLLQITSLATSADLRLDGADLETLYSRFPYAGEVQVRLHGGSGNGLLYAEPLPYVLLAAPFWSVFGAAGPLVLNMLLLLVAWFCCARLLEPTRTSGRGLLFAGGALFLGLAWPYVFRYRAEVLVLAAAALALYLGSSGGLAGRHRGWLPVSGAALALAAMHQPSLAILGLFLVVELAMLGGARLASRWALGAAAMLAVLAMFSLAWTGQAWPVSSEETRVLAVASPVLPSDLDLLASEIDYKAPGTPFFDRLVTALAGRHRGLLPYLPFALPALLLGLVSWRRSPFSKWPLLVALVAYVCLQVWQMNSRPWSAELGEPGWLAALPLLLAFAGPLESNGRASWAILGGFALAAPLVLTLTFQPLGSAAPGGPLAGHTRGLPWRWLPLESWRLGELPGWQAQELRHGKLWFGEGDVQPVAGQLRLVAGPRPHELWLESLEPLDTAALNLRAPARKDRDVSLASAEERQALDPESPRFEQIRLALGTGTPVLQPDGSQHFFYRLQLRSNAADHAGWQETSSQPMHNPWPHGFAFGAVLTWLGPVEELDRDIFSVDWQGCAAPTDVQSADELLVQARFSNDSEHLWPTTGAARVRLSYRWLMADGSALPEQGQRTDLADDVSPGDEITAWQSVLAPEQPGAYVLESDLLYENVAWFSSRHPDSTCRAAVEVR